ncbi:MAG: hypothetical protein Hals2KO_04040 [Halioglobus sp.]
MDNEWINSLWQNYSLLGSALTLAVIVVVTKVGKWLLFKIPAMAGALEMNKAEDKLKWKKDKYPPMVKASQRMGLYCNVAKYLLIVPFCVTLESQPLWQILLDVFVILMFYDFFYYLSHRFWFHGNGAMRQVHAVHHQARTPTHLDALYVHPTETFIGLALYIGSIAVLAAIMGKFHVSTLVITGVIFYQLNQVNHTRIEIDRFPYRTLTWITRKHHVHHENMHKGNYATITLLYDKMFGTLD